MAGFRQAILRGESEAQLRSGWAQTEALLDQAEAALAPGSRKRYRHVPRRLRHPAARRAGGAAGGDRDDRLPAQGRSGPRRCPTSTAAGSPRCSPESRPGSRPLMRSASAARAANSPKGSADCSPRWSCCGSASGCTARRRPTNGAATSRKRCRARCRADRPGSCSASPSSSSIARRSRPSFSMRRCGPAAMAATILAGALTAVVLLAVIAWAMLRLSRTLPIGQFFRYSAILIAILAVILAGKGVGALQEAGNLRHHPRRRRAADHRARPVPDCGVGRRATADDRRIGDRLPYRRPTAARSRFPPNEAIGFRRLRRLGEP